MLLSRSSLFLSRASLVSVALLTLGSILSGPAYAEPLPTRRASESIARRFMTIVPLQQCQYPRFWSHSTFTARVSTLTAGDRYPVQGLVNTNSSYTTARLREVTSSPPMLTDTGISPLLPSEKTLGLFHRITHHFRGQGYTVPETLVVIDSRAPNAYVRKGNEVVLTSAIARQVSDPSELAFILAHEVAHVALGHRVQGGISAEVAADTLALKAVTALGFNPCSGSSVLERLGSPSRLTLVSVTPRLHALQDQTSSFCG